MRPIQYACFRGQTQIFKFIIDCNKDQAQSQYQSKMLATSSTLVHLVAYKGNLDILKMLLDNGLNLMERNKYGDTCLHLAIRHKQFNFVEQVLKICKEKNIAKKDVDVENVQDKCTPMMLALLLENF